MVARIIYCIPSMVLYLFVLVALFKEQKTSTGNFYSLLITQAILVINYGFHFHKSSVYVTTILLMENISEHFSLCEYVLSL